MEKKYLTTKQVADLLKIGIQTLKHDIAFLRSEGLVIEKITDRKLHYTEENIEMFRNMRTLVETRGLKRDIAAKVVMGHTTLEHEIASGKVASSQLTIDEDPVETKSNIQRIFDIIPEIYTEEFILDALLQAGTPEQTKRLTLRLYNALKISPA